MEKTSEELLKKIESNYQEPFFIGYSMLVESLKHKNIINGLTRSLSLAQIYLKSDDVAIYKKGPDNSFSVFKSSHISSNIEYPELEYFINSRNIDEIKYYKEYEIDSDEIKRLSILPISKNKDYSLVIINADKKDNKSYNKFIQILKETFDVLIDKMNSFNIMKEQSEIDALTGLRNRLAYNKDIDTIKDYEPITFTIIDLFRLKYINDNIDHFTGDCYIKKTADILKGFFPSTTKNDEKEKQTGDEVYRVGGDEFIIISKRKTGKQVENILEYIKQYYIEDMDLNIDGEVIKGINYGIVSREDNESIDELYRKADRKMSDDKKKTYKKYGIDRRK